VSLAMAAIGRPSLALVVAAYNAGRTLAGALESVLRQDYDDWEVLVVDDGSTDDTLAVAEEYARRDNRIRVFSQPNAGTGGARNAALPHVRADFVGYLDADDLLSDDHMRTMVRLMEEFPGRDIYSSDGVFVRADGSSEPVFGYGQAVSLTIEDLLSECLILGGGALIRTSALRSLGGFREHMYGEDYDLWLRALAAGYTHVASPECLYIYHQSVPGQKSVDRLPGVTSAIVALDDLLESGLLSKDQQELARVSIANYRADKVLEQQAQQLRRRVERLVGVRFAKPVLRAIHAISWIVRPLRRLVAIRRTAN